jgi:hypothetical protein
MRRIRVTLWLVPKPDIGGFCSEGPLRAQTDLCDFSQV